MDNAEARRQAQTARPARSRGAARRARNARVLAFKVLYEVDIARHAPSEVFQRLVSEEQVPADEAELARSLVRGVLTGREEVDALIRAHAPSWPVEQLSAVERNILRIAIHELRHERERVPVPVAINEAVELAKMFGGDAASRFVNGVLGQIARSQGHASTDNETVPSEGDP